MGLFKNHKFPYTGKPKHAKISIAIMCRMLYACAQLERSIFMSILKIAGKVCAGLLGAGALIVAGKSGLGESLFSGKDDVDTSDLEKDLAPTPADDIVETPEMVDTTETEGSD